MQKFREYMLHILSTVQSNTLLSKDYHTFMNNKLFPLDSIKKVHFLKYFPKHYSSTISNIEAHLKDCQVVLSIVTLDILFK